MKKIVKLNPKFFTECVDDVEYVVPICNVTNKAIDKAIEKMIKESEEYVKYIGVVRPTDLENKKIKKE